LEIYKIIENDMILLCGIEISEVTMLDIDHVFNQCGSAVFPMRNGRDSRPGKQANGACMVRLLRYLSLPDYLM